jgi:alkaline phosphatase D
LLNVNIHPGIYNVDYMTCRFFFISVLFFCLAFVNAYSQKGTLTRIAFGSCSHQDREQVLWPDVVRQAPQLWIWMGDNIYADTEDMVVMKAKYEKQKKDPGYQQLLATCPVVGTWDDHDYGANDGGKEYTKKKESKERLLEFLDVPANHPVRKHEGVYAAYVYGKGKRKVKIILLDTRYFRDPLTPAPGKSRYAASEQGDILGEEQWQWLENELKDSDAALHIIGSSIQFIPEEQEFEKWKNLNTSRNRMLSLLTRLKPRNTFFISGDRHIAELSKMEVEGLPYPLYDFTSSGLTHTWESGWEANKHRVGDMIKALNFGMILIDWSGTNPAVTLKVIGKGGETYLEHRIAY